MQQCRVIIKLHSQQHHQWLSSCKPDLENWALLSANNYTIEPLMAPSTYTHTLTQTHTHTHWNTWKVWVQGLGWHKNFQALIHHHSSLNSSPLLSSKPQLKPHPIPHLCTLLSLPLLACLFSSPLVTSTSLSSIQRARLSSTGCCFHGTLSSQHPPTLPTP